MKKTLRILALALCCAQARADTTIDPAELYAYAANAGWVNAYADGAHGAVIGQSYCSGCLYGANLGWITLGDGSPVNGYAYGNADGADAGVNHNGTGKSCAGWRGARTRAGSPSRRRATRG